MSSLKSWLTTALLFFSNLILVQAEVQKGYGNIYNRKPPQRHQPCPENACADCANCGPRGPRGCTGPIGPDGIKGPTGPAGDNGINGDSILAYMFYGTVEYTENSYPAGDVNLNFTSATVVGNAFTWNYTTVTCQVSGVYAFYYSLNPTYSGKVYITINGLPATENSVFGKDYTELPPATSGLSNSPYYGQIIRELVEGDVIQVRWNSLIDIEQDPSLQKPILLMYKLGDIYFD